MAKKTTTATKKAEKAKVETLVPSAEAKVQISGAILTYQHEPHLNKNIAENTLTEEQSVCVGMLDKAMKVLPDMELNRITIPAVLDEFLKQAKVSNITDLVGKTVKNVPYMSTTKNILYDIVKRRYGLGLTKPVCFVIHTEGKAKGIDVEEALNAEGYGGGQMARQREVILARGTEFRVGKYVIGDEFGEVYPIIHLYAM